MARSIEAAAAGRVPGADDYLHCRYTARRRARTRRLADVPARRPRDLAVVARASRRWAGTITPDHATAARLVARYLAALRHTPAADAWEESADRVHTSTLGAMLAGLRAMASLGAGRTGPRDGTSARSRRDLLGASSWTKWAGNDGVDASLLWLIAPYGLVDASTPAPPRPSRAWRRDLEDVDGGVHRYREDTYYGGGAWPLLTVALATGLPAACGPGDRERARRCAAPGSRRRPARRATSPSRSRRAPSIRGGSRSGGPRGASLRGRCSGRTRRTWSC